MRRAVRSEWIKLTTVRSGRWTFLALLVVTVAVGALATGLTARHWTTADAHTRATWDPTNLALSGLAFGQLAFGALGALVMSGEHSTGLVRSSLAAVPDRRRLLAAKALVLGSAAVVAGVVVSLLTFAVGQSLMQQAPSASLSDPAVLRAVLLSGAYLGLIGLFGLGVGAVVRNSAGSIATTCGFLLVLPWILSAIPGDVVRFAPEAILASSVAAVVPESGALGPWSGFALMAGYAAVALAAGGILLQRRDA